jgi:hypothetical protein
LLFFNRESLQNGLQPFPIIKKAALNRIKEKRERAKGKGERRKERDKKIDM